MKQKLDSLIIASSNYRTHDPPFEEGEIFHQLYVWNSSQPNNPKRIDVPYKGGCHFGFNDLKIANDKLIVANSARLLVYDLNNLDKPPNEIKNADECTNMLYITGNKLINVWQDVIQIRDLNKLDLIENASLIHAWASQEKTYGSVKFEKGDESAEGNTFSMFPLLINGKGYVGLNRGSSYLIDPENYVLKKISIKESQGKEFNLGEFEYGVDFQFSEIDGVTRISSLNDFYETNRNCTDNCDGFKTVRVHRLEEKNGAFSLTEEKPINLEKKISSILLDSENNLKVLAFRDNNFELLTYDFKKAKIVESLPIKIKNQHALEPSRSKRLESNAPFQITAYLKDINGDLKIINHKTTKNRGWGIGLYSNGSLIPVEEPFNKDEIYINSAYGKHDEIKLTGASYLCQIPEIGSRRSKFIEIALKESSYKRSN